MCSKEGEAMRQRVMWHVTTMMATLGLLLLGKAAVATQDPFEAMGMAKLPEKAAPDFTLSNLDEKQVSLRQYRGKVVFLNFWATWCIPCREEMPALEQLHQTFQRQDLIILAINLKEGAEQVKTFFQTRTFSFPALLDQNGSVFRDYSVAGMPTTYLIGRDGKLLARGVGARDWTRPEGQELIRNLIKKAPVGSQQSIKAEP
jgi:thiol-disulfide isomerase/thioredoxin